MKMRKISLLKIIVLLVLFIVAILAQINIVYGDTIQQVETIGAPKEPTISDVYEALLKTKDDKIFMLEWFVNALLGGFAIVATISVVVFAYFYKKGVKNTLKAEKLIKELQEQKEVIDSNQKVLNKTQEQINTILSSTELQVKLNEIEENVKRLSKFEYGIMKAPAMKALESCLLTIKSNFLEKRMTQDEKNYYTELLNKYNEYKNNDSDMSVTPEALEELYYRAKELCVKYFNQKSDLIF